MKKIWRKCKKNEQGAVVVEATLSLSFFMFMIVTLLSFVNLCTAQAKVGMALNETAKEISQYTYIYSLSGLNDIQTESVEGSADTRADVDTVITNTAGSLELLVNLAEGEIGPDAAVEGLDESLGDINEVVEKIKNSENPSDWLKSLLTVGGNEAYEMLKGGLAGELTEFLMRKNLVNEHGGSCDVYLEKLGVVDGIDGLKCTNSTIFAYGSDDVILNCRYELKVLRLLNLDITYSISQNAYTKVWGGKSLFSAEEDTGAEEDSEFVDGSFALVGDEEGMLFGVYASRAEKDGNYVDVIIHTSSDGQNFAVYRDGGWVTISHRDLANWLKSKGYKGDKPIRLISCGAGADTSNLAQNLANKLGVEVKAPSDTIWASPDGELTIGPTADSNTGDWNSFKPGVNPNAAAGGNTGAAETPAAGTSTEGGSGGNGNADIIIGAFGTTEKEAVAGSESTEKKEEAATESETTEEESSESGTSAKGLIGHDFEDYLSKTIGGEGSFSVGGRDFDGGTGNRWWKAKSGNYWSMLEENPNKLAKFKSDMGDRLRIATENCATYEIFSNTPIPESIKQWLTKKGITFTELLD